MGVWNSMFVWEYFDSRLLFEFRMYIRMGENGEIKNRFRLEGV